MVIIVMLFLNKITNPYFQLKSANKLIFWLKKRMIVYGEKLQHFFELLKQNLNKYAKPRIYILDKKLS